MAFGEGGVQVAEVTSKADLETFINVPWTIYQGDPYWIPPLRFERRDMLNRDKHPYYQHAEAAFFVARMDGKPVGRISAQVDRLAQEHQGQGTGHFGFLEAVDDPLVFDALFEAAESWLRARGMTRVLGPFTPSINEESGLLVEGFDEPPRILMGHARPYYGEHVEELGYRKAQDLWAYDLNITHEFPTNVQRILDKARKQEKLKLRRIRKKDFENELKIIIDIFNDAWRDNWGFIPMTDAEIDKMGKDLKPFIKEQGCMIAEWDGKPTAFMLTVPDINQAAADLNGNMLPFGWAKLVWRLMVKSPTRCRVPLMGVRQEFQGTLAGASMALLLIETIRAATVKEVGYRRAELSWILESNPPMQRILEMILCRHYKTYRMYEKAL
jgi:GNAT superfamily N-acetyltransferase